MWISICSCVLILSLLHIIHVNGHGMVLWASSFLMNLIFQLGISFQNNQLQNAKSFHGQFFTSFLLTKIPSFTSPGWNNLIMKWWKLTRCLKQLSIFHECSVDTLHNSSNFMATRVRYFYIFSMKLVLILPLWFPRKLNKSPSAL